MPRFAWDDYRRRMVECVVEAVGTLMREHANESFYTVALHGLYAEEDGKIGLPLLGANSQRAWEEGYGRWAPPNWCWTDVPYADPSFEALHRRLVDEACRVDTDHWYETFDAFVDTMVDVAKAVASAMKASSQATDDFCVFVSDEQSPDAEELIVMCVGEAKFRRLFAKNEERAAPIAAPPFDKRWRRFLKDLGEHEKTVVKQGASAIPMLLYALNDEEQHSDAAGLLGAIGIPDERVIAGLRQQARTGNDEYYRSAAALALLGDIDFLLELGHDRKTGEIARSGITGLYSYTVSDDVPLDLEPLERFMASEAKPKAMDLWAGCRSIRARDTDAAIAGLESRHGVVRELAATMLGKESLRDELSAEAAARVLDALRSRLSDEHVGTRRRTLTSFGQWGAAAKPHLRDIRALLEDPHPAVARAARFCVEDIEEE